MELLYLILSFLLLLALYGLTNCFLRQPRNLPPSPFPCLPLIGHLYLLKFPLHRALSQVARKHGPVLYLWFGSKPAVLVSSPSGAQECFTKNDIILANRPPLLVGKYLGRNYTSLVWSSYGSHWRSLRRIATIELLSSHRTQMLSPIRTEEVRTLTVRLFRASVGNSESTVDIRSELFELAFNVMTRMIAGKKYYGEGVENQQEAKTFREIAKEMSRTGKQSSVLDFMPFMRWFGYGKVEKKLMEIYRKRAKLMQNAIEENRRMNAVVAQSTAPPEGRKKNIIQVLLSLQETEPASYPDEIINGLLAVLYQASTETSATAMEWAFSLLLSHPEVMEKAQAEIDSVVGNSHLIEESDVAKLPYLLCIIKETLRLHPPVPLLLPHYTSEDCTIHGYRVPRSTTVLVNAWAIQNDPEIWVEPEKFKPQRFEGSGWATDDFTFMPFGSGRRGCPGETLAMRSIGLALGSLLQCFHWEKITRSVDMREGSGFVPAKAQPLTARCIPRPNMLSLLSKI